MTVRIGSAACAAGMLVGIVLLCSSTPALAANDPYVDRQWGLERVGAERSWSTGRGAGVTIAIVDSGVDLHHPDLAGAFVPGRDFVDDDNSAMDANGHGTHVAGIAAARSNNALGVAGVAPAAKIMPVRVLDEDGRGEGVDVEDGVRWAVDHGADVVNLSLSGGVIVEGLSGGTLNELVQYAWDHGAVPVIAAGNGGLFRTDSSSAKRLLVTATDPDDHLASYATQVGFADWGLAAPGGDSDDGDASRIYSTLWADGKSGYGWAMGTSMAAPHVSGAAAILRGLGLDATRTVARLLDTAKDIGKSGDDFAYGNGLLDVSAATTGLRAPSTITPPRSSAPAASSAPEPVGSEEPARPSARPQTAPPVQSGPDPSPDATVGPSPTAKVVASDEMSERSALVNLVVAGTLLGAAAALVGYGSLRYRSRSRGM